ncbi:MAG: hypothetical protein P4L40_20770 [Terracidiphilus sp.]|nr:hypothetical protein [Terracidiphilus sp.]
MLEVQAHQHQLDALRENYTYAAYETVEDLDGNGHVNKAETTEKEDFFVNGHLIERIVKKGGKPLAGHDLDKETERVTKLVEKAEKTPRDQPLEGQTVSVGRLLEIMDVRNARRVDLHGRATIVFDFVGRKSAKTHGMVEDASKKLQGTIWIDEAGKQVAHMDVNFVDNFHVAGGLFANIQKGSNFRFDQSLVNGELWLPTAAEATVQARVLLLKNVRQHFVEHDADYKRFRVETQSKDTKPAAK